MGVIGSVCRDRGLLVVFCGGDGGCVAGIILSVIHGGGAGVGILWGGIIILGLVIGLISLMLVPGVGKLGYSGAHSIWVSGDSGGGDMVLCGCGSA
jgi:hypothetical protein